MSGDKGNNKVAVIVAPLGRCGSNWVLQSLGTHPLIQCKTEPFRQQLSIESRFNPVTSATEFLSEIGIEKNSSNFWWSNFNQWLNDTDKTTVIKEVNLFFQTLWAKKFLGAECRWIVLNRDVRGCLSSYKRRNLFARWRYQEVYDCLLNTIRRVEPLHSEYQCFLDCIDQTTEIEKLAFMYCLGSNEIGRSFPDAAFHYVEYSRLLTNANEELCAILEHLGLGTTPEVLAILDETQSKNAPSDDHCIVKIKARDNWEEFLSDEEERSILRIIDNGLTNLPNFRNLVEHGYNIVQHHSRTRRAEGIYVIAEGGAIETVRDLRLRPKIQPGENDSREQQLCTIKNELLALPDRKCSLQISATLTTNLQFCLMLNWLYDNGIRNLIGGNFFLVNSEIPENAGGRIFDGKKTPFTVIEGFEDHPVNWITYLGAALFSRWIGCKMLTSQEYALLECEVGSVPDYQDNCGRQRSDTSPVRMFGPSANGFYDVRGNVYSWVRTNGHNIARSSAYRLVKGGAWNKPVQSLTKSHRRNAWFTARSTGVRVARSIDVDPAPLTDEQFLDLTKNIWSLINSCDATAAQKNEQIEQMLWH